MAHTSIRGKKSIAPWLFVPQGKYGDMLFWIAKDLLIKWPVNASQTYAMPHKAERCNSFLFAVSEKKNLRVLGNFCL